MQTGKRAIGMSEKDSTEHVRLLWEQVANEALEAAGSAARIDCRSLKNQGITDREPQKHIGPVAKAISDDGRPSWKVEAIAEDAEVRSDPTEAQRAAKSMQDAQERLGGPLGRL